MFALMLRPPEQFALAIRHVTPVAFMVYPFRSFWDVARAGHVDLGQMAPDFNLETSDHSSRVQLSSFRGQKPVVLVFGSYT